MDVQPYRSTGALHWYAKVPRHPPERPPRSTGTPRSFRRAFSRHIAPLERSTGAITPTQTTPAYRGNDRGCCGDENAWLAPAGGAHHAHGGRRVTRRRARHARSVAGPTLAMRTNYGKTRSPPR